MANRDTQQAPSTGGIFSDLYDIGLGKFKEIIDFEDAEAEAAMARANLVSADRIDDERAPAAGSMFGGFDHHTLALVGAGLVLALLVLR